MTVCLVAGGAGFIGCAISTSLVSYFDRLIVVDNLHPQIHSQQSRPCALAEEAELIEADVAEPETWDRLLQTAKPDIVVYLAAETGTGQSLTEASRHGRVNVLGATQMLDAFVRNDAVPRRIVLSSSRTVYGEGAWQDLATGAISYPGQRSRAMLEGKVWDFVGLHCLPFEALTTEPRPTSIYGATKLAQEHILLSWCLSFGVELATLRLQNVYGPGQSLTNSYTGIVSLFAQMARKGNAIPIYEDGQIIRDFVYIDDVADAIVLAACRGVPSTMPYDVGSGAATSIIDLAHRVAANYGAPPPAINGMFRNGDVRSASCKIERTCLDLDWTPKTMLPAGLRSLCAWIEEQRPRAE